MFSLIVPTGKDTLVSIYHLLQWGLLDALAQVLGSYRFSSTSPARSIPFVYGRDRILAVFCANLGRTRESLVSFMEAGIRFKCSQNLCFHGMHSTLFVYSQRANEYCSFLSCRCEDSFRGKHTSLPVQMQFLEWVGASALPCAIWSFPFGLSALSQWIFFPLPFVSSLLRVIGFIISAPMPPF